MTLIPNGTRHRSRGGRRGARPELLPARADDRFTWTYAGNMGLAQGLEAAVEAAGASVTGSGCS